MDSGQNTKEGDLSLSWDPLSKGILSSKKRYCRSCSRIWCKDCVQWNFDETEEDCHSCRKQRETENRSTLVLRFKRTLPMAILPQRQSLKSAGYDLSSCIDTQIPARGKARVETGWRVAIPKGHYGRIAPRSSLAWTSSIDVGGGVIDPDYRGEIFVLLFNHSDVPLSIRKGDRIAQLILEKISTPLVLEVQDLDETERGDRGFGSTGK